MAVPVLMMRRNVPKYAFGPGSISELPGLLPRPGWILWLYDQFFSDKSLFHDSGVWKGDEILFVDTSVEPTVESVDSIVGMLRSQKCLEYLSAIVAIGGGSTMDTAKAVSILLTNPGSAADYQGWDLVKNPGVYKVGVPTISGTGSESSSTAVLVNKERNVKLGINSPHSVFDSLILDPDLTKTVPREQRFWTAMDTWCHCTEYLDGRERTVIQDSLAVAALDQMDEAFYEYDWLDSDRANERLMVASYLGGSVAGCTGLIHPFSAGLGTVLGIRHGLANCVAAFALGKEFLGANWLILQHTLNDAEMELPDGLCAGLDGDTMDRLYQATLFHEKPLRNALGAGWRDMLTRDKVYEIFRRM